MFLYWLAKVKRLVLHQPTALRGQPAIYQVHLRGYRLRMEMAFLSRQAKIQVMQQHQQMERHGRQEQCRRQVRGRQLLTTMVFLQPLPKHQRRQRLHPTA